MAPLFCFLDSINKTIFIALHYPWILIEKISKNRKKESALETRIESGGRKLDKLDTPVFQVQPLVIYFLSFFIFYSNLSLFQFSTHFCVDFCCLHLC